MFVSKTSASDKSVFDSQKGTYLLPQPLVTKFIDLYMGYQNSII